MKKGLKIAAITVGVIIILMLLLPFAFQGKIADIVKTEGNKALVNLPMIPLYKPEKLPPPSTYSLFSEIAVTIFPKYSSKTQSCMPLCCRTDVPTGIL